MPYQNVQLTGEDARVLRGMHKLFWVFGWTAAPRTWNTAHDVLESAAAAAEAGGHDWGAVRRGLSGELPAPTWAERMERHAKRKEREAERAAAKAAVAAAKRRRRDAADRHTRCAAQAAASSAAARATTGTGAAHEPRYSERESELLHAAHTIGVTVDAAASETRRRYLAAALREHPDKGGDTAAFQALQAAYAVLGPGGASAQERTDAASAEARATRATARANAAATASAAGPQVDAATAAAELADAAREAEDARAEEHEAEAEARRVDEAAKEEAEAWKGVAEHVSQGADAFYVAWSAHKRLTSTELERAARAEGHASRAAQCDHAARQRHEEARAARAEREAAELREMYAAERRVMERMRTGRQREAEALGELSGRRLLAALAEDWRAVADEYVVEVPWAAWCVERCRCRGGRCRHRDSVHYEQYTITQADGRAEVEAPPHLQMVITAERCGARQPVKKRKDSWDVIDIDWRHIAGQVAYGTHNMHVQIEPKGEEAAETDSGSDSERSLEAAEARRAKRRARGLAREAVAAQRAAAEERQELAELGEAAGEADAVTLAAETAMQEEDGGDEEAAPEPEARAEGEDEATAALGDEERGNRADGPAAGGRRAPTSHPIPNPHPNPTPTPQAAATRAGRHWWSGAWMGRVATDDFAASWGGRFGGPLDAWRTERTTRASDTAMRVGEAEATHTTRVAARTAAAEAQRRGRTLQLALADGRATTEERAATERIAAVIAAQPQGAERAAAPAADASSDAAGRAAIRMRRARPAANAAAEATRARTIRALMQYMAARAIGQEGGATIEATMADMHELTEQPTDDEVLRDMVHHILAEREASNGLTARMEDDAPARLEDDAAAETEEGDDEDRPAPATTGAPHQGPQGATRGMGNVDIGKFEQGKRTPTCPTASEVTDVAADRQTRLGNPFLMQNEHGKRDERYRPHAVRATAMALAALEEDGRCDVRRIADEGPDGHGWMVGGRHVKLRVESERVRADPTGANWWQAVRELGTRVARGECIRLLCHCRRTRRQTLGGKACHCEPTAEHVEREATRQRRAEAEAHEETTTGGAANEGDDDEPADKEGDQPEQAQKAAERGAASSRGARKRARENAAATNNGASSASDANKSNDENTQEGERAATAGAQTPAAEDGGGDDEANDDNDRREATAAATQPGWKPGSVIRGTQLSKSARKRAAKRNQNGPE
jgi:curved DNA-binding protein CbpA